MYIHICLWYTVRSIGRALLCLHYCFPSVTSPLFCQFVPRRIICNEISGCVGDADSTTWVTVPGVKLEYR